MIKIITLLYQPIGRVLNSPLKVSLQASDNNLSNMEGGDIRNRQALSLVLASFESTVSPMNWFQKTEPDKGREFQKSMLFRSIR